MARTEVVVINDDLDGEQIDATDVRVFRFSVDGTNYIMDVREETYEKAKTLPLNTLIEHARREGRVRDSRGGASGRGKNSAAGKTQEIRRWANDNGFNVSAKGRIPLSIVEAYEAATK